MKLLRICILIIPVGHFEKGLDKAAKKAKLTEIDSIETGKTVFGGKVTVSQEDRENVTTLAKKEITSLKQTKKLRRERDELKVKLSAVSSELAEYKKKKEEKRYFSHEKLNKDAHRISTEEQLHDQLSKALTVIDRYGLREEYEMVKPNAAQRKNVLE